MKNLENKCENIIHYKKAYIFEFVRFLFNLKKNKLNNSLIINNY